MRAAEELRWHLAEVGNLRFDGLSLSVNNAYVFQLVLAED